jgi:AT-rich interactive domain-containing protein 4A
LDSFSTYYFVLHKVISSIINVVTYYRDETESKCDSEGEEDEEDMEPCLTGTKVKVKYGRGKTQKIYEASIKSTEIDDGEVLYLVHYYGWNVR